MDAKKVSFVVPVYKTELYLERSLKSLLEQDYENIEIVVVADGESAEAKQIYDRLHRTDKRLIKYVTIPHAGACKARNTGFTHTTGDYVSFWDSDCYMETGAVRVWVKSFDLFPKVSFVYSGYNVLFEQKKFIESNPFDKYLLTCENYISTMNPMKREVFPGFDEKLESLQDWDMWLTITEKGHTGHWNEESAFDTEAPKPGSISYTGTSPQVWQSRYDAVRNKHGITGRHVVFTSIVDRWRAIEMAKLYNQDFIFNPGRLPHDHKVIYNIGLYANYMEQSTKAFANTKAKKFNHWTGLDIDTIYNGVPYRGIKPLVKALDVIDVHYCENETTLSMLKEIGVNEDKLKVLPLPMDAKPIAMPKSFKVYCEDDGGGSGIRQAVVNACPDIKFESPDMCEIKNYACFLSLTESNLPSENLKRFLAADRYCITTYKELYAGYTEPRLDKIINSVREAKRRWRRRDLNQKAGKHYRALLNPDNFRKEVIDATA